MTSAYDRVRYPSQVYTQTHPATIGAIAALAGRKPPPFPASRVLEIGCGEGLNLIAMAISASEAEFVGVDLAETAIDEARETASQCGAANVRFEALDLATIDGAFGDFDFIIAHGVYAWTPAQVRSALLRVIAERLSPDGLALVSYNALPGARLRQALRDMLLYVTESIDDPKVKLETARAFLAGQIKLWSDTEADEAAMKSMAKRLLQRDAEVLYHDELGSDYAPQLVSRFAADAARAGLAYLCDAAPNLSLEALFPSDEFAVVRAASGESWLHFEQLADFRAMRTFRSSILTKGGTADWRLDPARLRGLWASAELKVEGDAAAGGAAFLSSSGVRIKTASPTLIAFLNSLAEAFPLAVPLDAAPETAAVAEHIYRLFMTQVVDLSIVQQPLARTPGDRPAASPLARVQAAEGQSILATLRHRMIQIENPAVLGMVPLFDGRRTRADLAAEFIRRLDLPAAAAEQRLNETLAAFARQGLMAG